MVFPAVAVLEGSAMFVKAKGSFVLAVWAVLVVVSALSGLKWLAWAGKYSALYGLTSQASAVHAAWSMSYVYLVAALVSQLAAMTVLYRSYGAGDEAYGESRMLVLFRTLVGISLGSIAAGFAMAMLIGWIGLRAK
jgi:hypothetical protein